MYTLVVVFLVAQRRTLPRATVSFTLGASVAVRTRGRGPAELLQPPALFAPLVLSHQQMSVSRSSQAGSSIGLSIRLS
jgi:hypothetical protein